VTSKKHLKMRKKQANKKDIKDTLKMKIFTQKVKKK